VLRHGGAIGRFLRHQSQTDCDLHLTEMSKAARMAVATSFQRQFNQFLKLPNGLPFFAQNRKLRSRLYDIMQLGICHGRRRLALLRINRCAQLPRERREV